jgi:hypothetical protein
MITALIIMHFFGGGNVEIFSPSEFKTIERTISETARRDTVTQAMESLNARFASVVDQHSKYFEQLSEIDHNVNSREAAYDKILDELWQARREVRRGHIDDVFTMRENMTRDEWSAAFGDVEK